MVFYQFIKSKDVRASLADSGYRLTAKDAARLVLENDIPLYEKLDALRKITETLPDEFLDLPAFVENGESLHECISAYVRDEEAALASFYKDDGATFFAEGYAAESGVALRKTVCKTPAECFRRILHAEPGRRPFERVRIQRFASDGSYACSVTFDAQERPICISGVPNRRTEALCALRREPFTLPHPFRRFDLVWQPVETDAFIEICKKPILLDRLPDPAAATPLGRCCAAGYYCMFDGSLDYAPVLPVTTLEFLPADEYGQEAEILSLLRKYLAGEAPLCGFVNEFAAFCMRRYADGMGAFCETEEPAVPVPPADEAFFAFDDDFPF